MAARSPSSPGSASTRSASRSTRRGCGSTLLKQKLEELKKKGIKPKYIYTIPTVQNPTGAIMGEARRAGLLKIAAEYGVMIFEDECYSDLIWDGKRPPSLYAMAKRRGRDPYRLVLQVDRAGAARRLHRRQVGHPRAAFWR